MSISDTSSPGSDALRIFISYSRADTEAADALLDALKARGFSVKIDRRDLPYGEKWQEQLSGFIAASDTVIFLLSPDSIQSKWCRWELDEVSRLSKRLFVIRVRDTGVADLPASIAAVQILPQAGLYSQRDYENTLVAALNTDSAWLRKGSTLADDAREWLGHERDNAMLLRGRALAEAEAWVKRKPQMAPQPAADVVALIAASRQARTAFVRRTIAGIFATIVAAVAGGAWYWHSYVRIETSYCRNYAEAWAEPSCIGLLTPEDRAGRAITYAIDRQAGRVIEMRRLNGSNALADSASYPHLGFEVEPWDRDAARWVYARRDNGLQVTQLGRGGVEVRVMDLVYEDATHKSAIVTYRANGAIERQISDAGSLDQMDPDRSSRSRIGQYVLSFDAAGRVLSRAFEVVGGGAGASDADGAFGRSYTYRADGLIASVTSLGAAGSPVADKMGIQTQARSHSAGGELTRLELRGADGGLVESKTSLAGIILERDQKGNLVTATNFDGAGNPAPHSEHGVTATRYVHDERGNIVEVRYLDPRGEPVRYKTWGVEVARWRYNGNGDYTEIAYFDRSGTRVLRSGWRVARTEYGYDPYRRINTARHFGLDDKPAVRADWNIASENWVYTPQGKSTEARFFGVDGKPALRKDWNAATGLWTVNRYGYITRAEFRDAQGNPTLRRNGKFAFGEWDFDEHGNNIEARFFGIDRNPIALDETGAARARYTYDAVGNRTDERFFDAEGNAVASKLTGSHHTRWIFDGQGNTRSVSFLDAGGQAVPRKDNGYARRVMEYNARGELVRERFEDTGGQPTVDRDTGAWGILRERDRFGREVRRTYLDPKGNPAADKKWGVASVVTDYDERGAVVGESYEDAAGRPTRRVDIGAWKIAQERDAAGAEMSRRYLGSSGEAIRNLQWGVARIDFTRDGLGNVVAESYFGPDGLPTLNSDKGVARIERSFGPFGSLGEHYSGEQGEPVVDERGVHEVRKTYDAHGNTIDERYLGVDGMPANIREHGVPHIRWIYDRRGNWVSVSYLDADGKRTTQRSTGIAEIRRVFDAADNVVLESYLDVTGQPTFNRTTGAAGLKRGRDRLGRETERTFLDVTGAPTAHKEWGVAAVRYDYDAFGATVSESYSDIAGKNAIRLDDGFWKIVYERDAAGVETARRFFGPDGNAALTTDWGIARIDYVRDRVGNALSETYYDAEGAITLRTDNGIAGIDREFGPSGATVESYRGLDGRPTVDMRLVSKVRWTYDDRGRTKAESYFDREGNPTERPFLRAYAVVRERNALGWITRETKLDGNGKPTSRVGYAAETRWVYDARGNTLEKRFFDEAGQPFTPDFPEPVAVQLWSYDARDRRIGEHYKDENGSPATARDTGGWRAEYDVFGNQVVRRYFEVDGRPGYDPSGEYEVLVQAFDDLSRIVSADYHWSDTDTGAADMPPLRNRETTAYNALGQRSEVRFHRVEEGNEEPEPIAVVRRLHDARGRLASLIPVPLRQEENPEMVLEVRYSYDDRDRLNGVSFHKPDGALSGSLNEYEIARAEYVCDLRGNTVGEKYFGATGPVRAKGVPARIERVYGQDNELVSVNYYDRNGRQIPRDEVIEPWIDMNAGIPRESEKRSCRLFST